MSCYFCPRKSVAQAFGHSLCEPCLMAYMAARAPGPVKPVRAPKVKAKKSPAGRTGRRLSGKYAPGTKHGCWTVKAYAATGKTRHCVCDCGAEREVTTVTLLRRLTRCQSCTAERSNPKKWVVGTQAGSYTILESLSGRTFRVRCTCGWEGTRTQAAVLNSSRGKSTGCMECRWKVRGKVVTACVHCGVRLVRPPNVAAARPTCESCRRDKAKATSKRVAKRNKAATVGRVCLGCARDDSEATWGGRATLCGACERQGERNGWAPCGAPLWKGGLSKDRTPICRAHGSECPDAKDGAA